MRSKGEHAIKWHDKTNLIPEENLLIGAALRDRLNMTPLQVADFLERFMQIPEATRRVSSLKARLAHVRTDRKDPYRHSSSIQERSDEEALAFRIIEERTGLMGQDIEALYSLKTPTHKRHAMRYLGHERWTQDKLMVLGGLLLYCCDSDAKAAMSFMIRWLGVSGEKYGEYADSVIGSLKKTHEFFKSYLETAKADESQRQKFEELLRSKPETADWTIESVRSEYEKRARIDWGAEENQLLWAGAIRYCGLSWNEARIFLEAWFERGFPKYSSSADFNLPYTYINKSGKKMEDVAPIRSPNSAERRQAFESLLQKKGWTIQSVRERAERGDFSEDE